MSEERISADYLKDITDEINRIESFIAGLTYDEFIKDEKTVYAVIRCFEIIGEAVKNIPAQVKERYPLVPWKRMSGMRDKLIHEYFGVDCETLWRTIKKRIPEIKPMVENIARQAES